MTMPLFALIVAACTMTPEGEVARVPVMLCAPVQVLRITEDIDDCAAEAKSIRDDHQVPTFCVPYGPIPVDPSTEPPA